jgi:hypothetical protein
MRYRDLLDLPEDVYAILIETLNEEATQAERHDEDD